MVEEQSLDERPERPRDLKTGVLEEIAKASVSQRPEISLQQTEDFVREATAFFLLWTASGFPEFGYEPTYTVSQTTVLSRPKAEGNEQALNQLEEFVTTPHEKRPKLSTQKIDIDNKEATAALRRYLALGRTEDVDILRSNVGRFLAPLSFQRDIHAKGKLTYENIDELPNAHERIDLAWIALKRLIGIENCQVSGECLGKVLEFKACKDTWWTIPPGTNEFEVQKKIKQASYNLAVLGPSELSFCLRCLQRYVERQKKRGSEGIPLGEHSFWVTGKPLNNEPIEITSTALEQMGFKEPKFPYPNFRLQGEDYTGGKVRYTTLSGGRETPPGGFLATANVLGFVDLLTEEEKRKLRTIKEDPHHCYTTIENKRKILGI